MFYLERFFAASEELSLSRMKTAAFTFQHDARSFLTLLATPKTLQKKTQLYSTQLSLRASPPPFTLPHPPLRRGRLLLPPRLLLRARLGRTPHAHARPPDAQRRRGDKAHEARGDRRRRGAAAGGEGAGRCALRGEDAVAGFVEFFFNACFFFFVRRRRRLWRGAAPSPATAPPQPAAAGLPPARAVVVGVVAL